jgi:hypothetical protein
MRHNQFFKDFLQTKFKQIFIKKTPCRAQTLQKENKSIHTLIRTTRPFIYPQYRVLLGKKLCKLA